MFIIPVALSMAANSVDLGARAQSNEVVLAALVRNFEPEVVPIFYQVMRCESTLRQWDDSGNIVRGKVNKKDVGILQISESYWLGISSKLGYDIYTLEGNVAFARYLYDKYGFQPWSASSSCWMSEGA